MAHKKFKRIFLYICLIISALILIKGIFIFWTGFHNLDVAQNFLWIQENVNYNFAKLGINEKYVIHDYYLNKTKEENLVMAYLDGSKYIFDGLKISMLGSFLFGIFLAMLFKGD